MNLCKPPNRFAQGPDRQVAPQVVLADQEEAVVLVPELLGHGALEAHCRRLVVAGGGQGFRLSIDTGGKALRGIRAPLVLVRERLQGALVGCLGRAKLTHVKVSVSHHQPGRGQ